MRDSLLAQRAEFVLTTDLCPAVLIRTQEPSLHLFRELRRWGLGMPTSCFYLSRAGVKRLALGQSLPSPDLAQGWLLFSFAGSEGWRVFDVPMLVCLQHRPREIAMQEGGVRLRFERAAADVVVAPLYGYEKPLQRGVSLPVARRLQSVNTWEWRTGFPSEVRQRCERLYRLWRAIPLYAQEQFATEGDDLLLRTRYTFHTIRDEWGTTPLRLAPLPPTLALAWLAGKERWAQKPFPMQIEGTLTDPAVMTPYGPWLGVADTEEVHIRFPLLRYVHTHETYPLPETPLHSIAQRALQWVRQRLSEKFRREDWQQIWDHGGAENYCWQVMGDRWYAKALPYLPDSTQQYLKSSLREYVREHVLQERNYQPFREVLLLVGPGIGTWGGYDDAGKFSSNLLETLWCYAHYTGDWRTIRERWKLIQRFFVTPYECDWKSFGRYTIAELGDEAAPPLYMARMAYQVGDMDSYRFACYVFVRELVHHYIKQVGHHYFVQRQPWHSTEVMPSEVYLTNLWADIAGWQIDGPTYPRVTGERQYENRWVRFGSEDVARFYRDVLGKEIRGEMDWLLEQARQNRTPYRLHEDTAHIAPSLVRLRSLLLREPVQQLAQISPPERWQLGRPADGTAFCLSLVYAAVKPVVHRLIPQGNRSDWQRGLEAYMPDPFPGLVLAVEASRGYPVLRWWAWEPPQKAQGVPAGERWSFGMVGSEGWRDRSWTAHRLNWNTVLFA
ncbi:MAG: hypothetical protein NZ741_06130 [Armatimonadetes bacterium]|nr:hypothetical protein [Armatimonadota bacterium]